MSKGRDFAKEIAEVAKRKDISQGEVDFKMRKIYEAQRRALRKELDVINKTLDAYDQADKAKARLSKAVQEYTELTAKQVLQATQDAVQQVARQTAEGHVKAGQRLLKSVGAKSTLQVNIIASNEVNSTVARTLQGILKGTVYPDGIPLSQRIWSNQQAIHKDIHTIIANAMQEGKGIADISDLITKYVDPAARKDWNKLMQDGFHVHRRDVEYNAQRLARTVSQHAYQKATEDRIRGNPFVTGVKWIANGSRACDLCLARDGKVYDKGDAPLDHPNGMCILEPVVADDDTEDARLIAWARGGEDKEVTAFARSLGYEA